MGHVFRLWDHDVIIKSAERGSPKTERFADSSFHAIPIQRASSGFDRNAQPEMPDIVWNPENDTLGQATDLAVFEKAAELPRKMEASMRA